ncbi:hypothetical protein Rhopal_002787-T1 [Rhodotorula paludigena]|uniref:Uncharacterized protein n=1 Tax=Rhodotorula paludigena TaxID=86838 RepID=A0AAV5GMA0_9BASI|nr:hypothetical protein Rhopal_002787-T1 [Rhodotorula paludigena]
MISTDGTKYDERGQRASAAPLATGDVLRPLASALNPDAVAWPTPGSSAEELQRQATGTPNEQRLALEDLLAAVKSTEGWRSVTFRLTEPLVHGNGRFSQVWRAVAGVRGHECGPVVVKILAEALWRPKEDLGALEWWYSLEDRINSENHAYSALRPLQGRDVPHCYGSFSFSMPWGEAAVGFVLEDLLQVAKPFEHLCKRELAQIRPSLKQLQRIFALNVTSTHTDPARNIFVLRSAALPPLKYIFAGFGRTAPLDEAQREHEVKYPGRAIAALDERWLAASWFALKSGGEIFYEWLSWAHGEEPELFTPSGSFWGSGSSDTSDDSDGDEG